MTVRPMAHLVAGRAPDRLNPIANDQPRHRRRNTDLDPIHVTALPTHDQLSLVSAYLIPPPDMPANMRGCATRESACGSLRGASLP